MFVLKVLEKINSRRQDGAKKRFQVKSWCKKMYHLYTYLLESPYFVRGEKEPDTNKILSTSLLDIAPLLLLDASLLFILICV